MDEPIRAFDTDASRSILAAVTDSLESPRITLRDSVGGLGRVGSRLFIGSGHTVADDLESYAERTGVDGFNVAYHVTPVCFIDVAEHLVPELRRRGRLREGDAPPTLRQRLFPDGSAFLPLDHPGAAFRSIGSPERISTIR